MTHSARTTGTTDREYPKVTASQLIAASSPQPTPGPTPQTYSSAATAGVTAHSVPHSARPIKNQQPTGLPMPHRDADSQLSVTLPHVTQTHVKQTHVTQTPVTQGSTVTHRSLLNVEHSHGSHEHVTHTLLNTHSNIQTSVQTDTLKVSDKHRQPLRDSQFGVNAQPTAKAQVPSPSAPTLPRTHESVESQGESPGPVSYHTLIYGPVHTSTKDPAGPAIGRTFQHSPVMETSQQSTQLEIFLIFAYVSLVCILIVQVRSLNDTT